MRCVIYKCHSFLYFGTNGAPYIAVCITSIIILLSHLLHLFDTCQLSVLDSSILPYICLTMSMDVALLSNPNMQYGYMDMHVLSENFVRPSKLDCLFSAMETLLLHAGGRFIFIIHCHFLLISYSIFKNLELVCEGFNTHDGPGNDFSYYRNAYKSHVGLQITARRANFAQLAPTDLRAANKMAAFNIRYPCNE